jgi:formiminoglutamase/agmatinase
MNRIQGGSIYEVDTRRTVSLQDVGLWDYGDVFVTAHEHLATIERSRDAVLGVLRDGGLPVVIGGDHAISHPVIQAFHEHFDGPLGIIHFDAHPDLVDESPRQGRWSHSSPIRRALELERFSPASIVQIGLRGFSYPEVHEFAQAQGILQFTAADTRALGVAAVAEKARAVAGADGARVLMTIDMDVLDPAFAPGVGAPDAGGLTSAEMVQFVRELTPAVDAMDINEINPLVDHFDVTSLLAAHLVMTAVVSRAGVRGR